MKERWEKGLCYNCDEKWSFKHVYKNPKLFLMEEWEPGDSGIGEDVVCKMTSQGEENTGPEIFLHALTGSINPKTIRILGKIEGQQVVILIDSGSTHNFLEPTIIKKKLS